MTTQDWISLGSLLTASLSVVIAAGSLWFTHKQWAKVRAKIGMIQDWETASEVLPAWYTARMMTDYWVFGLLMTNGKVLVVNRIVGLTDDGNWMDIELETDEHNSLPDRYDYVFAVADDRTRASIQVKAVVAAFELVTS